MYWYLLATFSRVLYLMQYKMDLHVQWLIGVQSVLCRICDVSKREILICFCGIRFSLMPSELLCGLFFFFSFFKQRTLFLFLVSFSYKFYTGDLALTYYLFFRKNFFFYKFRGFFKMFPNRPIRPITYQNDN